MHVKMILLWLATSVLSPISCALHPWPFTSTVLAHARYFPQKQDHFDPNNGHKWLQAYYADTSHFHKANPAAPVFLYVGGEGPLSPPSSNFVLDFVPQVGALFFAVEHRYYGCHNSSSCPYNSSQPHAKHLRFLSSQQALEDLAFFHEFATKQYALGEGRKWVLWGGSYPGMLAAWGRALYPAKFHAAVASSAPVTAVFDMVSFNDVVAAAYANATDPGIAGSHACAQAIRAAHAAIGDMLSSGSGRAKLAQLFPGRVPSAAWLADPSNAAAFCGCGAAHFPAQANNPMCGGAACGIRQICGVMADGGAGDPVERLATVARMQQGPASGSAFLPHGHAVLEGGEGEPVQRRVGMTAGCEMDWTAGDVPPADVNYWGYQTCTEFGFYQSCDVGSGCFYTQGLIGFEPATDRDSPSEPRRTAGGAAPAPGSGPTPTARHQPNAFCGTQFGLSDGDTRRAVDRTNVRYGALVARARRIFWCNGDVDPWHRQSHQRSPGPQQPVLLVPGASHCQWMRAAGPMDEPPLAEARRVIYEQVREWLREP